MQLYIARLIPALHTHTQKDEEKPPHICLLCFNVLNSGTAACQLYCLYAHASDISAPGVCFFELT